MSTGPCHHIPRSVRPKVERFWNHVNKHIASGAQRQRHKNHNSHPKTTILVSQQYGQHQSFLMQLYWGITLIFSQAFFSTSTFQEVQKVAKLIVCIGRFMFKVGPMTAPNMNLTHEMMCVVNNNAIKGCTDGHTDWHYHLAMKKRG